MPCCVLHQSCPVALQSGGSQLESLQLLLTDARQHAADLQTDKAHLQQAQTKLQQALAHVSAFLQHTVTRVMDSQDVQTALTNPGFGSVLC